LALEEVATMQDEIAVKLVNAAVQQSTTNEHVCAALDRNTRAVECLESRMAVQPSAPLLEPRTIVARTILVTGVAALVGACTALAWVGL
jgi:hypothetical protein